MQLGAWEIAIIGVGGTVAGSLIGAWIGYRLSLQLEAVKARRKASERFIDVFYTELADVYPTSVNWPKDIDQFLRLKFPVLRTAVSKFRHYLPPKEWDSFDKTWFCYYCATGREVDKDCQCYHFYMPFSGTSIVDGQQEDHDNTKTYKDNFRHNVDNLLKYAKIT
jgi:hypothetical protein